MRRFATSKYLTAGYAIGLLLIATLSSVIWATSVRVIDAQEAVAAEVNVSGRQRMLSQRIAWMSEKLDRAASFGEALDPALRSEIGACAALMYRAHQALLSRDTDRLRASAAEGVVCAPGDAETGAPGEMSDGIATRFFGGDPSLDHSIRQFIETARLIAGIDGEGPTSAARATIEELAEETLPEQLDALTFAFQREGEARIETLMTFKTAMWIATLSLLVLEVLLIFRPLARGIHTSLDDLERTVQSLRERERRNVELQGENAAKDRFLAHMSHEFRTPLNAIIGFAELLNVADKVGLSDERRREYSGDIRDAGHHLLGLVDDILDLAQLDADVVRPEPIATDAEELADSAVKMMRPIARERSVDLDFSIHAAADTLMWGDPRMVRQILVNLLANAVKFNQPGGWVRLTVEALEDGAVRFTVADNGQGMSPDAVPEALEPFNRGDRDPAIASDGAGLGLALCKRMAELHGGGITMESEVGRGTTVSVLFPARPDNVLSLRAG